MQQPPPHHQMPREDLQYYSQPSNGNHPAGKGSFIISMVIIGLYLLFMLFSVVGYSPLWLFEGGFGTIMLVLVILFLAAITGLILGISGASKNGYQKGLAIVGIILNSIYIIVIGIMMFYMFIFWNLFNQFD